MKNSLKRLAAILLTLVMLVGCASALAETTAFEMNLRQHLSQIDLSQKQMVINVDRSLFGSEVNLSAQMMNGLVSCVLATPGVEAEAQTDGQTLWISDGRYVYAIPLADVQHLVEDFLYLNPLFRMRTDPSFARQISVDAGMLLQAVLGQGLTTGLDENGNTVYTVNLTGRQILDGLADWLDSKAESAELDERTLHIIGLFVNAINKTQPDSGVKSAEDAVAQVKELVHQVAAQLRGTQTDLTITGTITMRPNNLDVALVISVNNQPINFDFNANVENGQFALNARVYNDQMGNLVTLNANFTANSFNVTLDVPTAPATVTLNGMLSKSSFRAELKAVNSGRTVFTATLTGMKSDDALNFTLNANAQGRQVLYLDGYIGRMNATLTLQAPTFSLKGAVSEDAQGRHPWNLEVTSGSTRRPQTYAFAWDGETLTVAADGIKESFHGREISESQYAIDVSMEYPDNPTWDPETATVLFTLTDGENGNWKLTMDAQQGEQLMNGIALEITDQQERAPLADKVTMTLDEQALVDAIVTLLAPRASYSTYNFN